MLALLSPLSNCDGEFSDGGFFGGVPLQVDDIGIDFDDVDIFFGLPELGDPDDIFSDIFIDGRFGEDETGSEAKSVEQIRKCDQEKDSSLKEEVVSSATTANSIEKTSKGKGSHGKKRKVKVDWTPELHRRFVQAVEQLGLEKAVPSRILELMGIDCLTRQNIASHLQKYRSHRKHLQAREAEAARWRQRQQIYSSSAPAVALPPQTQPAYNRPLHVWGHPPRLDPNLVHLRPKHLHLHPSMPWALPPPPRHLPIWPTRYPPGSIALTHGMSYFPRPLPAMRFPPSSVVSPRQSFETHDLSKESIDGLIVDVIAKPWLPLPLGLKAPSVESVIKELQKKGISKIPPIR